MGGHGQSTGQGSYLNLTGVELDLWGCSGQNVGLMGLRPGWRLLQRAGGWGGEPRQGRNGA